MEGGTDGSGILQLPLPLHDQKARPPSEMIWARDERDGEFTNRLCLCIPRETIFGRLRKVYLFSTLSKFFSPVFIPLRM